MPRKLESYVTPCGRLARRRPRHRRRQEPIKSFTMMTVRVMDMEVARRGRRW